MAPEELQGGDRVGPRHRVQQAVVANLAQANRIFILGQKEVFVASSFIFLSAPVMAVQGPAHSLYTSTMVNPPCTLVQFSFKIFLSR